MDQKMTKVTFESLDNKYATAINGIQKVFELLVIEDRQKTLILKLMYQLSEEDNL